MCSMCYECLVVGGFGASEVNDSHALCFQDAHNCIPELDDETAMFAVYDGHGGKL